MKNSNFIFSILLALGIALPANSQNAPTATAQKNNPQEKSGKKKIEQIPAGRPVSIGKQRTMQLPPAPEFFFINKLGKQTIPFMLYEAGTFKEGLAAMLIADQWGYVDKEGTVQIGADFDLAGDFSEGLAPVKIKDKWGYVDKTGKMAIEARFAAAEDFKNGFAVVHLGKDSPEFPQKANDQLQTILKDTKMPALKKAWLAIANSRAAGIIDKKGEFVFDPFYSSIQNFTDELALAKEGSTIVFLNKKGQVTLRPTCQDAKPFSEGLAAVKVKDKWGFISTSGATAIKANFDAVEDFHKGLAAACVNQKWGFINKKGKWEIQPKYDVSWEGFETGVAIVGKDMCPIPNTHVDVQRVGSGFLVARRAGSDPDFDESITPLEIGYFAYPDYRFSIISREGKPVVDKQFDHVGPLSDGARTARIDGKFGFIDNQGNTILKPQYKAADSFSEGLALVKEGATKPRLTERNETLMRHPVPALVSDPELIKKDVEVCSEVIKLDPSNAQAFRDRGFLLCSLARFQDSLSDFDQVIKLCSSSSEGYYWRGMANMQLGRNAEAAIDFTNAIEMEPSKPQNLFGRSLALKHLKRGELALNDINRAIALYDHPYYRRIRGEILEDLGQHIEALSDLQAGRRAPELEPWPVGPKTQEELTAKANALAAELRAAKMKLSEHGRIALLAAELADATDDLRTLKSREEKVFEIEQLGLNSVALRRKALSEAEEGTADGALPPLYKNDLANSLSNLAGWYVKAGQFEKAAPLYEEALKLARDIESQIKEADYLIDLGKMYSSQKEYEKAQDSLKKAMDLLDNPTDAATKLLRGQALNSYAIVLNHLQRPSDAKDNMKEASNLLDFGTDIAFLPSPPPLPHNASAEESYELALQCKSLGLIETSRDYMRKSVERASGKDKDKAERFLTTYMPKRPVDLKLTKAFQKGRIAELTGNFPTAEKCYNECIEIAPDFEWPYESIARLNRLQGDLESAERMIRKAISINPNYVDGWLELARIEKEQGANDKARDAVAKALSLDPDSQLAQLEKKQLPTTN